MYRDPLAALAFLAATPAALATTQASSPRPPVALSIELEPVGCVVAQQFPKLAACVRPAPQVGRTLLYFRAQGRSEWYFVPMTPRPGEPCFDGVLPKPLPETAGIEYYVQALSRELGDSRTEDFRAAVVANPGQCGGKLAYGLSSALVVLGVPQGAPAVPPGFSSTGLAASAAPGAVAAGGGSAAKVGLIVGGGVAAIGGAVLAARSAGADDGSSPGSSTTTTTTLPPAPPVTTLPAGPTVALGFVGGSPSPGSSVQDPGANFVMNLALTISVQCSADVPNARLFAMLRRGATTCVVSYADFGLTAGASRTVTVRGFVAQAACRPAPFATDSVSALLYDMNGSPTVPLGTASFAVPYSVVP